MANRKRMKSVEAQTTKPISVEVSKRLREQFPMTGYAASEDAGWTSLTASAAERDLNTLTQKRMQEIAFYLFDTNPMAHRIIEIGRDFVVGDGFSCKCDDPKVQEVVDEFWHDTDNDLDCTIDENIMELALFGENCFPLWVNPVDGSVKIGYIDPAWIIRVAKDRKNPRLNREVFWKKPRAQKEQMNTIVHMDRNPKSATYGRLVGNVVYWAVNKPINASRGRSDLLSLADWLDGHDQFLFARLERAFLLNTFIWDIEAQGMNSQADLEEFLKTISVPKPGSIRAHNEKVKWTALSPKLEAQDASNEARLFRTQILGGAGYPEHWFGEPSKTTRATALETSTPTLRKLKSRQKKIKYNYRQLISFVIDQAIIHGTLDENVDTTFDIIVPSIASRDDKGLAQALDGLADALIKAVQNKWIKNEDAASIFKKLTSQVGIEELADGEDDSGAAGYVPEDPEPEDKTDE